MRTSRLNDGAEVVVGARAGIA